MSDFETADKLPDSKIKWHTEQRRLGDLKDWEKNPRFLSLKEEGDIKRSLDTFGLADPLVINTTNQIIGGHQRKKIINDLDALIDVRVPSRELTEREAAELNIRLNKNQGDWEFGLLNKNFELDDLKDWGFTDFELGLKQPDLDFDEEWKGMPEFNQEDKSAFRTIIIHLGSQEDVDNFAKLLNQKISDKTKYLWFPEMEIVHSGIEIDES